MPEPKLILKAGKNGNLIYSKDANSKKAIAKFKQLIEHIPEKQKLVKPKREITDFPLVETEIPFEPIARLSPKKKK